jgi:hypothetical protein
MSVSREAKGGGPQTDALRLRKAYGDGRRGEAVAASGREKGHEADLRRVSGSAAWTKVSDLSRRLLNIGREAETSSSPYAMGVCGESRETGGECSGEEARRSAETEDARALYVHNQRSARDKEKHDAPRSSGGRWTRGG